MSEAGTRGPQVDPNEELYRFITTPDWWVADQNRPSSAAFYEPKFSVNVASQTTLEESAKQLRDDLGRPDGGIVSFNCGMARTMGFDARWEQDDAFPNNKAHAHIYYDGGSSSRKKNARKLAQQCQIVQAPKFQSGN